jgi:hypothetical protein
MPNYDDDNPTPTGLTDPNASGSWTPNQMRRERRIEDMSSMAQKILIALLTAGCMGLGKWVWEVQKEITEIRIEQREHVRVIEMTKLQAQVERMSEKVDLMYEIIVEKKLRTP